MLSNLYQADFCNVLWVPFGTFFMHLVNYLENNPTKYLLSPRWERIEVRGDRTWIFTPTLPLPPQGGGGKWSHFSSFEGDEPVMKDYLEKKLTKGSASRLRNERLPLSP
jgi:hypothetical protein